MPPYVVVTLKRSENGPWFENVSKSEHPDRGSAMADANARIKGADVDRVVVLSYGPNGEPVKSEVVEA